MQKKIKICFLKSAIALFLVGMVNESNAQVITHINKVTKSGWIYYDYTVDYMSDAGYDNIPNPCYNKNPKRGCYFGIAAIYADSPEKFETTIALGNRIEGAEGIETIGEIIREYLKKYSIPYNGNIVANSTRGPGDYPQCITFAFQDYDTPKVDSFRLPGQICGISPPQDLTCVVSGSLKIDYGSLVSTNIDGQSRAVIASIKCNQSASLKLLTIGDHEGRIILSANGNLEADTFINGKRGFDGVRIDTLANIDTTFTMTTILSKKGEVDIGPFHGSGTLIITME